MAVFAASPIAKANITVAFMVGLLVVPATQASFRTFAIYS
jgi:hypothetical protein